MSKQRLILLVLSAIAAGLPAWALTFFTTELEVLAPDGIKAVFYIIIPVIAMGALAIWALRVAESPAETKKTRWMLYLFGPFGAFYLLYRVTSNSNSR